MLAPIAATIFSAASLHLALGPLEVSEFGQQRGAAFVEYFVQQVRRAGIEVTTPRELATVLGVERQKQLLGCDDSSGSCIAELAGALGADGVITGSIGKVGEVLVCSVKVIDARARVIATATVSSSDEGHLLDALDGAVAQLTAQLGAAYPGRLSRGTSRAWALLPAAAGVVLAAVGVGLNVAARDINSRLASNPRAVPDEATLNRELGQGYALQAASWVLIGAGGAALAAAAAVALLTGSSEPATRVGVAVGPKGELLIGLAGAWP